MQYFSPQAQWLHYVALLEQMNGAFSELTTFEVCLELLHCSCVSMLRSVFSNGSSLFSSKRCVSFNTLSSCRMAAFADCVTVLSNAVSSAVGKDALAWNNEAEPLPTR